MFASGSILDRCYQLMDCLGCSPARQTWLALDQRSQEQVVVKILSFSGAMDWQDLKLFEREFQILRQLNHPAIPAYRDHFSHSDPPAWFAIVHTYIPGSSLQDLVDQGKRFTEGELRKIAREVLEILDYLHGQIPRILHRDIKPSNLIWGVDDRIHLVDFGAVQSQSQSPGKTFTVVGTYGYTPLEQYGGRAVPASDLYALGVTLVHLVTGQAPNDLPQKQGRLQFRRLVDLNPKLTQWLEQMIEPIAERRIPTARRALAQLQSISMESLPSLPLGNRSLGSDQPLIDISPEILQLQIPGIRVTPSGVIRVVLNPVLWIALVLVLASLVVGLRPMLGFWALSAAPLLLISYVSLTKFLMVRVVITDLDLQITSQLGDWIVSTRRIPLPEIEEILSVPVNESEENARYKLMVRTERSRYTLGAREWSLEQIQPIQQQIKEWLSQKPRSAVGQGDAVRSDPREGRGR